MTERYETTNQDLCVANQEVEVLREERCGLLSTIETTEREALEEMNSLQMEKTTLDGQICDLKSLLEERLSQIHKISTEKELLETILIQLKDENKNLSQKSAIVESKLLSTEVSLSTLEQSNTVLKDKLTETEIAIESSKSETAKLLEVEAALRATVMENSIKLTSLTDNINSLTTSNVDLTAEVTILRLCNDDLKERLSISEKSREMLSARVAEVTTNDKSAIHSSPEELLAINTALAISQKDLADALKMIEIERAAQAALTVDTQQKISVAEKAVQDLSDELINSRQSLTHQQEKQATLEAQVQELQAENIKLCGHNNQKQKIQATMQMKKDLQEQGATLKQQQEHIMQLTLERDAAKDEIRKIKSDLLCTSVPSVGTTSTSCSSGMDLPRPHAPLRNGGVKQLVQSFETSTGEKTKRTALGNNSNAQQTLACKMGVTTRSAVANQENQFVIDL